MSNFCHLKLALIGRNSALFTTFTFIWLIKNFQYEYSILWTLSLRIPWYKATLLAGIPWIWSFLQVLSNCFANFLLYSFLYSSPFPAVSFTFSANCTLFFFLPFFFSSEYKQERRVSSWGSLESFFCLEKARKRTVLETTMAVAKTKDWVELMIQVMLRDDERLNETTKLIFEEALKLKLACAIKRVASNL